jgi:hypothetical protein
MEIIFEESRDGSPMARIDGKISFPSKEFVGLAKPGEIWEVEVVGQNKKGTVLFLRLIQKIIHQRINNAKLLVEFWCGSHKIDELPLKQTGYVWHQTGISLYREPVYVHPVSSNPINTWGHSQRFGPSDYAEAEKLGCPKDLLDAAKTSWEKEQAAQAARKQDQEILLAAFRSIPLTTPLQEMSVSADSYCVKVASDSDWGLHKADPGYFIRVEPLYKDSTSNYTSIIRPIKDEVAKKFFGPDYCWLDIDEGAEDESFTSDEIGPCQLAEKVAIELRNQRYIKLQVALTPDQIAEIEAAYPDRENKEFATEIIRWLKKEEG